MATNSTIEEENIDFKDYSIKKKKKVSGAIHVERNVIRDSCLFTRQYLTQIVVSAPGYSMFTLYSNKQIKVKHHMVQNKVIWT